MAQDARRQRMGKVMIGMNIYSTKMRKKKNIVLATLLLNEIISLAFGRSKRLNLLTYSLLVEIITQ